MLKSPVCTLFRRGTPPRVQFFERGDGGGAFVASTAGFLEETYMMVGGIGFLSGAGGGGVSSAVKFSSSGCACAVGQVGNMAVHRFWW